MSDMSIGFLGAGQMARALARGFVASGQCSADAMLAADPVAEARQEFAAAVAGARVTADNRELGAAEVVFLAVKPQHLEAALAGLRPLDAQRQLVVSIAAGVTLARLSRLLDTQRLIRVMPNTPALIGLGASAFSGGAAASEADRRRVQQLLESVGMAVEVPETLLDAVTGLSGSGPAFVYTLLEALSDGGVRMGLPRAIASALAAHTVRGAAALALQSGTHPAVLRDQVTSPGGTTIAGLQSLENHGFRGAVMAAVEAAARRSQELGDAS